MQAAAEEEARKASTENNNTTYSERANYWEDLLKDKYEVNKVEEFNAMGKGKRSRKQVSYAIWKATLLCDNSVGFHYYYAVFT